MLTVTHRSLAGTLKLRSVLQQRSEGHVWRREECFGPLSSRWSGDGGVRLTVIPSYLHSHRPLPKNITPTLPSTGAGSGHRPTSHYCLTYFLSGNIERGMLILLSTETHIRCQRGVRWEGHSHLVVLSDKWMSSQTDNKAFKQSPPERAWHTSGLL